jgi:methyl-accepting chemotaxis protein
MLATLVPSIHQTAKLVKEISAASNEQSIGTEQVNKAVQQLDRVTQQTAVSSEQIASTAEGLTRQAELLQQMIQFFQIEERTISEAGDGYVQGMASTMQPMPEAD